MAYSKFTLQEVETKLGIGSQRVVLFDSVPNLPVPTWLEEQLERGREFPLMSEKARGELIVMPILMACSKLATGDLTVYSGARLDVDPEKDLMGECDFIVSRAKPIPELRAPLIVVVEAKKNDIEAGLGQCVAQMIASRTFNENYGTRVPALFGCVTTWDVWQFLRLIDSVVDIDLNKYYLNEVGRILGVFQTVFKSTEPN